MEKETIEKIMKMWKQKKGVPHIAVKLELPDKEVRDVVQDPRNYHVEEDGEEHMQKLMLDVQQILHRHENGFDVHTIGVKMRLAESYIQKVVDTGAADMETYLRKMYNVPKPALPVVPEESEAVVEETTNEKKATTEKKAKKTPGEPKETLADVIKQFAGDLKEFTEQDMLEKCATTKYSPASVKAHLKALDLGAKESTQKAHPSLFKKAFLNYDKETKKYSLPT